MLLSFFLAALNAAALPAELRWGQDSPPSSRTPAQEAPPTAQADDSTPMSEWQRLIVRNDRVSFSQRTGALALEMLGRQNLTPTDRTAALFAIGAGSAIAERPRLLSWAQEGEPAERAAAVLGMGELGRVDMPYLRRLAEASQGELVGVALLAVLRAGAADGEAVVQKIADDASSPYTQTASELLRFVRVPMESVPSSAARRWLDLRWEAARRFGLIDGEAWSEKVLAGLLADQNFLDRVVYQAASRLKLPAVSDHFLEVLLSPGSPERVAGAVSAIPAEVEQLVLNGLWAPADEVEWTTLVREIDLQRLESFCPNILRQARALPSLRTYASLLLARAGKPEGIPLLELELTGDDQLARSRIVEALGATGDKSFVTRIAPLMNDGDAGVRNSALVGLLMLGQPAARDKLATRLTSPDDPEHVELLAALCRNPRSGEVRAALLAALPSLPSGEQVQVATALSLAGRTSERGIVREVLQSGPPPGELGIQMVQALCDDASPEDLTVLRSIFPVENAPIVDAELAIALVLNKDPLVLPVLREALWQEPWNRSVLAAGLLAAVKGMEALQDEIARPPVRATTRDMRRVGFAIGEWGGMLELEKLARRTTASDPALQGALLGALTGRTR